MESFMADYKFPTEMVELPSKGYFYFDGHPLSKGKVEVKYMTAREEDILTTQSYIKRCSFRLIISIFNYRKWKWKKSKLQ